MKILFVASEMTPLAKVGGLGDVIGSLPKALKRLNADARIILPYYEAIRKRQARTKKVFSLDPSTVVYELAGDSGVVIYLVENKKYLSRGPIYADPSAFVGPPGRAGRTGSTGEIERFTFFSQKIFDILRDKRFFHPDIVHANDWHTGLLVKLIKENKYDAKTVFTIHNLANQGVVQDTNLMREGIENADMVTTVSPTYAKEVLTSEYGNGLEKALAARNRQKNLTGILNGIDYDFWPKQNRDKENLQKQLGLKVDRELPVFALISRLTYQKGVNLIIPLVDEFVREYNAQFVFLGRGEKKYEKQLEEFAEKYPRAVYTKIGFDEKLAHLIYPSADFFLMPSLFEPCGLGQMIAMRYGTVPIVRATGGLKDSVVSGKTGFVFKDYDSDSFGRAMQSARRAFENQAKFGSMRKRCARENFSWDKSAKEYKKLYAKVI